MFEKRLRILTIIIILSIFGLLLRIFYLQFFNSEFYTTKAVSQRLISNKIIYDRGLILDRNYIPLVQTSDVYYMVIFPKTINIELCRDKIKDNLDKAQLEYFNLKCKENKPFNIKLTTIDYKKIKDFKTDGVSYVKANERYSMDSLAKHLIGYISSDGHGKAGIEKSYDKYLYSPNYYSVAMVGDSLRNMIPGIGYRAFSYNKSNNKNNIILTIDYHIQQVVEQQIDRSGVNGAAIVIDCNNGDILAMCSRPNFSQDFVEDYLSSEGSELINRAVCEFDCGSVFKIVTSSAILENTEHGSIYPYECTGSINVFGKEYRCSYEHGKGHGVVDLTHAFAYSCNTFFINHGLNVGGAEVLEYARKFGFGQKTLKDIDINESSGYLVNENNLTPRETANLSIGQGKLLATPLQIANMANIIANDGIKKELRLVKGIENNGELLDISTRSTQERVISNITATKIRYMMEQVVNIGTGKKASLDELGGIAGKTGTAQTGWVQNDTTKVHAWFCGFYPIVKPKYAMVVFIDGGNSGGINAAPLFKNMAYEILSLNKN